MPKQNILIAMLFLALFILAGCGTKGPLYIPEQRYPQEASQPAPQAAPEAPASQPTTKE
jgi:predicted small lipoprotein YifL